MNTNEGNLTVGNLFAELPGILSEEQFDILANAPGLRIERIVSKGQATPEGEWYDQDTDEWVVLLRGSATLKFKSEPARHDLAPGDWILIPAHARHRVEATAPDQPTVWLAVHFRSD